MKKQLARLLPESARIAVRNGRFRWNNRGFEPYVGEQEHFGEHFKFYVGDRTSEGWLRGGWDWTEIAFLRDRVVEPGDRVLEAGAHHGELMLFLARWIGPEGRIVTFEPVPHNVEVVRQNIELNGFDHVTLVGKAVGAETGTTWITDESNAQVTGKAGSGVEVDVVPLDAYADIRPTLVKIDVEGFEAEVLKGAQQVLAHAPKLHIELHPNPMRRFGASVADVLDLIGAERYELWLHIKGEDEVVPFANQAFETEAHLFALPR